MDVSPVALQRGATPAAEAGAHVARRIQWRHEDVQPWPEPACFDLISAQFMHLPPEPAPRYSAASPTAWPPAAACFIIGHHPSDRQTTVPRGSNPELLYTASEVAALLDAEEWEIVVDAAPNAPRRIPPGAS